MCVYVHMAGVSIAINHMYNNKERNGITEVTESEFSKNENYCYESLKSFLSPILRANYNCTENYFFLKLDRTGMANSDAYLNNAYEHF